MSTHSRIGIINKDGSIESIYCHFDGYYSHMGAILLKHFNSQKKARALIALGELDSIDKETGKPNADWTPLVGRPKSVFSTDLIDFRKVEDEFNYLYDVNDGKWLVKHPAYIPLTQKVIETEPQS